jgi:MacB-like protein
MFWSAVRVGFQAWWRHRLRTALTMLGITIGIAAVICTVSLGAGSAIVRQQLGHREPYAKSSNSVTLSAFVQRPTLPPSLNVSSSHSSAFWPLNVTVK